MRTDGRIPADGHFRVGSRLQTVSPGFSPVEVIIAFAIFGLVSGGMLGVVLHGRRLAQGSIYQNTAVTAAYGYIEQIKSMEYAALEASLGNPTGIPLPTKVNQGTDDPLYLNVWNEKSLSLNVDESGAVVERMSYWVRPTLDNLNTGTSPLRAIEVTLDFRWEARDRGPAATRQSSVRFARSFVPTF